MVVTTPSRKLKMPSNGRRLFGPKKRAAIQCRLTHTPIVPWLSADTGSFIGQGA
jgi:hypothetical protein